MSLLECIGALLFVGMAFIIGGFFVILIVNESVNIMALKVSTITAILITVLASVVYSKV